MIRFLLKATLPLVAAALLDQYCIRRDARRLKKERKEEIGRWEGEGGSPPDVLPPAVSSPIS
ncbi:MAG: hypothetical protein ACREBN_05065 [Burkholderiaceae bacterium]